MHGTGSGEQKNGVNLFSLKCLSKRNCAEVSVYVSLELKRKEKSPLKKCRKSLCPEQLGDKARQ